MTQQTATYATPGHFADLHFTRHFISNWRDRVGGDPDPDSVAQILGESIRIQPGSLLRDRTGEPRIICAIYWHQVRRIIIKLDPYAWSAITVMSDRLQLRVVGDPGR